MWNKENRIGLIVMILLIGGEYIDNVYIHPRMKESSWLTNFKCTQQTNECWFKIKEV